MTYPTDPSLTALLYAYMEASKDRLAPSSLSLYGLSVRAFSGLLGAFPAPSAFTRPDCFRFEEELAASKHSRSYQKVLLTLVRASFRWAYDHGALPTDVWADVRFRPRRQPVKSASERASKYWTRDQQAAFLDKAKGHRLFPLLYMALTTGLRIGELLGLTWGAVDLEAGSINVVQQLRELNGQRSVDTLKSQSSVRSLSITPRMVEMLRALRTNQEATAFVFVTSNGKPYVRSFVWEVISRTAKSLGLQHGSAHQFRHLHASNMVAAGVDLKTVQNRIGHANIRTTLDIYTHAITEQDRLASMKTDPLHTEHS